MTDQAIEPNGFIQLPNLIGSELISFLVNYLAVREASGAFSPDDQVSGSFVIYGDPAFDALLLPVGAIVGQKLGKEVVPTYSFVRLYRRGNELVPHTDRPECEHSVTLMIKGDDTQPWPLWLRNRKEEPVSITQNPGDGLLYHGIETLHWRDSLKTDIHIQVFLHFVDAIGPNSHLRFDGRESLGSEKSQVWK